MSNEFEKQVQQKMEELKLVPSEPVWQKVEMQIRKKKDRRKLVLWIPFLVFLLGGGLWIGIDQYSNQGSYKLSNNEAKKSNNKNSDNNSLTTSTANTTTVENPDKKSSESLKATTNSYKLQDGKVKEVPKPKGISIALDNECNVQKNISKKVGETIEETLKSKKEISVKPEEAGLNRVTTNEVIVRQSSIEKILKEAVPNLAIRVRTDTPNGIFLKKKIEPSISLTVSIEKDSASAKDSIQKQDTAAIKKTQVKKYAASKWKLNLAAVAGSSDLTRLNLFSGLFGGEKSLAAPNYGGPGTSAGGPMYYGPSPVKEAFSFSVGVIAKKQLARRTFFSTGLGYNYYSNTVQVGNKINQNRVLMDFAVSQYYSNTATSLQPYRNQYHFVSLPVAMDWQLLKKLPLNFHTGLSLQYMVQTNGLVFDYSTQSYFNSKDAFNRVQLFFEPALTYSVSLKQKLLTFGPQLQYGLSSAEKNNSDHHILSYGLKVQLQLNKK